MTRASARLPTTLLECPASSVSAPSRRYPGRTFFLRHIPVSVDPRVLLAVPLPITCDPYVPRPRRWNAPLELPRRRPRLYFDGCRRRYGLARRSHDDDLTSRNPLTLLEHPSLSAATPARLAPRHIRAGWHVPFPVHPNVVVAVPLPVTGNPYVARARLRTACLDSNCRRREPHFDRLRVDNRNETESRRHHGCNNDRTKKMRRHDASVRYYAASCQVVATGGVAAGPRGLTSRNWRDYNASSPMFRPTTRAASATSSFYLASVRYGLRSARISETRTPCK